MVKVGIIGAGIIGLATARQLAQSGVPVIVWEKEAAVARHQTGRNSGVAHAGIYYQPGSAKAEELPSRRGAAAPLLRRARPAVGRAREARGGPGRARDTAAARDRAAVAGQRRTRGALARRAGHPGARARRSGRGRAALPHDGIVDFPAIARAFADDVAAADGQVLTGTRSPRCAGTTTACRWSRRAGRRRYRGW